MTAFEEPSLSLSGWGTARADLASIPAMRKSLPSWAPEGTPGHFLKHADEQTVLAVAAVDQAIRSCGSDPAHFQNWAIIAAPRFIGRLAGTATLDRFARGGGPAISPHVIPQHSLHSISGALSILLASRQPNFGVGGAGDSLAEGLLAALTFPAPLCIGAWFVATSWDPEPQINELGNCTNTPVGYAVALALESAATAQACGRLRLNAHSAPLASLSTHQQPESAAGLCRSLAGLVPGGPAASFAWRLPCGAEIVLEAREMVASLAAAA
jgi:hypothetical protein